MNLMMPDNNLEDLYKLALRMQIEYPGFASLFFNHTMTEQFDGLNYALSTLDYDKAPPKVQVFKAIGLLGYDCRYDPFTDILSVYYRDAKQKIKGTTNVR